MDLLSQDARTAPWSSKRGTVSCFSGATLDLAAIYRTPKLPFDSLHRIYAQAPNASIDSSENIQRTGCPTAFNGVRHLSKLRLFRTIFSCNRPSQNSCNLEDSSSSQSSPCFQRSWIAIFAWIRKTDAKPTGSKTCATWLRTFLLVNFLGFFMVISFSFTWSWSLSLFQLSLSTFSHLVAVRAGFSCIACDLISTLSWKIRLLPKHRLLHASSVLLPQSFPESHKYCPYTCVVLQNLCGLWVHIFWFLRCLTKSNLSHCRGQFIPER